MIRIKESDCPHCKGLGFTEEQCLWGDGFDYRSSCGWCKGTGKVQTLKKEGEDEE